MTFDWNRNTSPFLGDHGDPPARFALRQVDDDTFELLEPFKLNWDLKGDVLEVSSDLIGHTDLASIPTFLGWFARRHGRHTPAALLHDQLITTDKSKLPANQRMSHTEADLLFREALLACECRWSRAGCCGLVSHRAPDSVSGHWERSASWCGSSPP